MTGPAATVKVLCSEREENISVLDPYVESRHFAVFYFPLVLKYLWNGHDAA